MITFFDELSKVIEPHGVAADRLNKDLVKLMVSLYCRGLARGMKLGGFNEDSAFYEMGMVALADAKRSVEKNNCELGD